MNLEVYKNGQNLVQKLPARNATNLAVKRAVSWPDRTADCGQGSADCVKGSAGKTSTGSFRKSALKQEKFDNVWTDRDSDYSDDSSEDEWKETVKNTVLPEE